MIYAARIREIVSDIIQSFPPIGPRIDTKAREQELEQLARALLEYARMKCHFYEEDRAIVDVTELAFRFRESIRVTSRALKLLEARGLAERTNLPRLWKLDVSALSRATSE